MRPLLIQTTDYKMLINSGKIQPKIRFSPLTLWLSSPYFAENRARSLPSPVSRSAESVPKMQPIFNKHVAGLSRSQFRRMGVPALVLGLCAFIQAAPSYAQLGGAESCFDQGPEKLPARITAALPPPPAALPPATTKADALAKIRPQRVPAKKPASASRENALNGGRPISGAKNPGAPLTAR
jgi:hypothetical protein